MVSYFPDSTSHNHSDPGVVRNKSSFCEADGRGSSVHQRSEQSSHLVGTAKPGIGEGDRTIETATLMERRC